MDTCILIPSDFTLVSTKSEPSPGSGPKLLSRVALHPGQTYRPDQGIIKLERIEIYRQLDKNDIRYQFGCYDDINDAEEQNVRHCNWVRFIRASSILEEVNLIGVKVKGQPVFQMVKEVEPNTELVVYFDTEGGHFASMVTALQKAVAKESDEENDENDDETGRSPSDDASHSPRSSPTLTHSVRNLVSPVSDEDSKSSYSDVTVNSEDSAGLNTNSPNVLLNSSANIQCSGKRNRERTWLPCEVCGKKFDRPSLLRRHMRTHTGEKPHGCDVCGKAFSTSSSLNTHRRIHSGEKPHQCKVCGKRFTASSNLYYHRMTHNKEKPHKCTLCSKSFPTPGDLKSHMYVHNGSWPFKCDICNRGFSKQTNLKNHLMLHTGDKPHECALCGKRFALQCNLKTHLKIHEGEPQEECFKCGGLFLAALNKLYRGYCKDCLLSGTLSSPASFDMYPRVSFATNKKQHSPPKSFAMDDLLSKDTPITSVPFIPGIPNMIYTGIPGNFHVPFSQGIVGNNPQISRPSLSTSANFRGIPNYMTPHPMGFVPNFAAAGLLKPIPLPAMVTTSSKTIQREHRQDNNKIEMD